MNINTVTKKVELRTLKTGDKVVRNGVEYRVGIFNGNGIEVINSISGIIVDVRFFVENFERVIDDVYAINFHK